MEDKINREKWLHVRLTEAEQGLVLKHYASTTHRCLSDYARAVLLRKPVVAAVRNESLQDLIRELALLRKDLNGLANNYNQAVHKLHTFDHFPQVSSWVDAHESGRRQLIADVAVIRKYMDQAVEKWLQS